MNAVTGAAPQPVFDHLARMTDDRGLYEHALLDTPRPEHGYCVDDIARALVVVLRERDPSAQVSRLARLYLDVVLDAQGPHGDFHNRMGPDGVWTDEPSRGDWWGRAICGLAYAATHAPTPGMRARALTGFRAAARRPSPHNRSMAFAAVGAGRILRAIPRDAAATRLLRNCRTTLSERGSTWLWPESRLRYANGAVAEALITIGDALDDPATLRRGLDLLDFLLDLQTRDGHLSVVPAAGRAPGETAPGFDQQPIEVATMAEACMTAYHASADQRWLVGVDLAWRWFLGENDSGIAMFDSTTGAGYDGLEPAGRNDNQGAESTLAVLATAQLARLMQAER